MNVPDFFGGFDHSDVIDSGAPVLARGANRDLEYGFTDIQSYKHFGTHTELSLAESNLTAILLPSEIIEPPAMNTAFFEVRLPAETSAAWLKSWKFSLIGE